MQTALSIQERLFYLAYKDFCMIKKLREDAIIPLYQTLGSAGLDLHSVEATTIPASSWALVSTGLCLDVPEELYGTIEAQIRPRSGLAAKFGVTVLNSPGTVDSDYKGEIKVILHNSSKVNFTIEKGDRIAQMVLAPVIRLDDLVLNNKRNEGGFGSTGS